MKNILTLDISTSSTGMILNGTPCAFCNSKYVFTKKHEYTKWFEITSKASEIIPITPFEAIKNYSDNESNKFDYYQKISDHIIEYVLMHQKYNTRNNIALIEGYSFDSKSGRIIDIVTLGTLVRQKLLDIGYELKIISPGELKVSAAKMTYKPTIKGKRVKKEEWRNNEGMMGGSFKKPEIYKSIIENDTINCKWSNFLRDNAKSILSAKKVPRPIDDINDAKVLYESYIRNLI